MAERLRKTGRKSNSAPSFGGTLDRDAHGTARKMTAQASAALAAASTNVARHPARLATRSAHANERAPEMPILAAVPGVARDMSLPSTRSASSLSPVI